MRKRLMVLAICACGVLSTNAMAQFSGPGVAGRYVWVKSLDVI